MSEAARYPFQKWKSIGDLSTDLHLHQTPRPFWIEFRKSAHRITDENWAGIVTGLLMAMEFELVMIDMSLRRERPSLQELTGRVEVESIASPS